MSCTLLSSPAVRPVAAQAAPFPYSINPDRIPTTKLADRAGLIVYACPCSCWRAHIEAWRAQHNRGNAAAPQPMPYRHLMFEHPTGYGYTLVASRAATEAALAETSVSDHPFSDPRERFEAASTGE